MEMLGIMVPRMIRTEKMMRPEHPSDPPLRQLAKEAGALSYTDEGTGVPLVCLHGGPGSVRDFRWIAPVLTEHFRVIRTEQPGFGGTPSPPVPNRTSALERTGLSAASITLASTSPCFCVTPWVEATGRPLRRGIPTG